MTQVGNVLRCAAVLLVALVVISVVIAPKPSAWASQGGSGQTDVYVSVGLAGAEGDEHGGDAPLASYDGGSRARGFSGAGGLPLTGDGMAATEAALIAACAGAVGVVAKSGLLRQERR